MITKIKKTHKTTEIYTDEADTFYHIRTYNTDLKRRLTDFAASHPDLCRQTDDDSCGCLAFDIDKRRFSFRLTEPYSDERRQKARESIGKNQTAVLPKSAKL